MKPIISLFTVVAALTVFTFPAFAAPLDNYDEALELAKNENKPVLLEFTGSDWCPPCKMMKQQTLSKDEFKTFADQNIVFVELDFPRSRQLEPGVVKQNAELQEKYSVQGYPTFILVDNAGKELGRTVGFMPGGPDAFIGWLKEKMGES